MKLFEGDGMRWKKGTSQREMGVEVKVDGDMGVIYIWARAFL
jgi:hypothetical protein